MPVQWTTDLRFISGTFVKHVGTFTYSPSGSGTVTDYVIATYPNAMQMAATRIVCLGLIDF